MYPTDLAAVPIETVASIAATLTRQDTSPGDAVRQAFELLEIAAAGRLFLKLKSSYRAGVAYHAQINAGKTQFESSLSEDVSKRDKNGAKLRNKKGALLPVPFDEAMVSLMPRLKDVDRMPRFREWIADSEDISSLKAGGRIGNLQKKGIPPMMYQAARLTFPGWMKASTSQKRSLAGKAGVTKREAQAQKNANANPPPQSSPSRKKKSP